MSDTGREFHLGEAFFRRARRTYVGTGAFTAAALLAIIIGQPLLSGRGPSLTFPLIVACVALAVGAVTGIRGYRRMVARYRDFRIVLFPHGLKRTLPGQEDLYIAAAEISRVISRPGAGCGVEGMAGQQAIWIPAAVGGYDELVRAVETWRTPEIGVAFWNRPSTQVLLQVILVAGIAVAFMSSNRTLVTAVSAPLAAYMAWAALALRRSAYVTASQKRSTGTLLFVIAVLTLRMIALWRT